MNKKPHYSLSVVSRLVRGAIVAASVIVAQGTSACVSGRSLCCFGPPPCFGYDNCSIPGAAPSNDTSTASSEANNARSPGPRVQNVAVAQSY